MPRYFLCTFIYFLAVSATFSQSFQIKTKFTKPLTRSRLSNQNIRAIVQDVQGFLWIGTDDGLNRFDGYDYTIYRNVADDTTTIVKNRIQCLFSDSNGVLWVSSISTGLHIYNRENDSFERIPEFTGSGVQVMRIMEDNDRNLWIGGIANNNTFIARRDKNSAKWEKYDLFPSIDPVYTMIQFDDETLWLGTRINGLYDWNLNNKELRRIGEKELSGIDIEKLEMDNAGNVWIATRGGLSKYARESGTFQNFVAKPGIKNGLPSNDLLDLALDGENLWIATENGGLSRLNTNTLQFINFTYDKNDQFSIVNNSIWTLYKDRENRIWFGSYANGICVLDQFNEKFYEIELPISSELINAVLEDSKGRFWVGTEDGVVMFDGNSAFIFKHDPAVKNSLSNKAVNCIYEDSKQQIWLGLWSGGLNLFDEHRLGFVHFLPDHGNPKSLGNPNVFSIMELSETNELVACTFGGLYILKDQKSGIFENAVDYSIEGNQLVLTAFEDSKNYLWVGSYTGLSLFDQETKKFEKYFLRGDSSMSDDRVNCIFEDSQSRLWVGSATGLYRMVDKNKFISYHEKDGLPVNYIQGILEDKRGHLWLGTTNGLVNFNPETEIFVTYDESDGLSGGDFRRSAFFDDKKGRLFFGGKGLNVFHPERLSFNQNPPPVYFTEFRVFNKTIVPGAADGILSRPVKETTEIIIAPKNTFFSIHYVGINFTSPEKTQYAYMMEGFDENWVEVGEQRFATFTNLNPGTYTFKVMAANNDGLWNTSGAQLVIRILPPFWATWWFRAGSFLGIISLVFGFYYVRVRNIETQNKKLEKLVGERTKELTMRNEELARSKGEISDQNEILLQKQMEIADQRDQLADQNVKLNEARKTIERKNIEIVQQNETLEAEVEKRTKELVSQNIQLQQFAFITAHNLRAPVARILGLGQLLKYPVNELEEKSIQERIINNTVELDEVVKDLNKILDIQYNTTKIWVTVDLSEELQNVISNLNREIIETGADIQADFSAFNKIHSVKSYINSILYNLISNALKYRHPIRKPVIVLKTICQGNSLTLLVSDNGLGIDHDAHGIHIFKLYKRFHNHVEGKGMGLYMVKTQVEALGGSIESSGEIDKGLEFRIKLPIREDQNH